MAPELRKTKKVKKAVGQGNAKRSPQAAKRKATEDVSPIVKKKQKPAKVSVVEKSTASKSKSRKESKSEDVDLSSDEVDEETRALVRTFDDGESGEESDQEDTFREGQDVGTVPAISDEVLKSVKSQGNEETGVVYLGHIPRGFFEHEIRAYFRQFGDVRNLRVSRSPKTGNSRGYAFVEFEEKSTAEIVAKTMDSYLLYGKVLRVKVVPKEQVHEDLFKGANRRFKRVPWNKMAGRELERPKSESAWAQKIKKEKKRRTSRAEKLKALGYDFEAPELKSAVAIVNDSAALENGEEATPEIVGAIEQGPEGTVSEAADANPVEEPEAPVKTKAVKAKKAKAKKLKA